jgi:hypothetical protein
MYMPEVEIEQVQEEHAQLLIPVGPRGIAMGEANLAACLWVESIFWNPAGVAKNE